MLYSNFVVCAMTCAFFAMLTMIYNQDWQYIILPIGILIWGVYKFFHENDVEYMRRNGINPDDNDWFGSFFDGGYGNQYNQYGSYNHHHRTTSSSTPRREGNTITWNNGTRVEDNFDSDLFGGGGYSTEYDYSRYQPRNTRSSWQNPAYKGMVNKCKRNFKIKTESKDGVSETRKSLFPSVSHRQ